MSNVSCPICSFSNGKRFFVGHNCRHFGSKHDIAIAKGFVTLCGYNYETPSVDRIVFVRFLPRFLAQVAARVFQVVTHLHRLVQDIQQILTGFKYKTDAQISHCLRDILARYIDEDIILYDPSHGPSNHCLVCKQMLSDHDTPTTKHYGHNGRHIGKAAVFPAHVNIWLHRCFDGDFSHHFSKDSLLTCIEKYLRALSDNICTRYNHLNNAALHMARISSILSHSHTFNHTHALALISHAAHAFGLVCRYM